MKLGEFNLGIREGDTVTIHFDEKFNIFYFQGRLPNNFVWLKTMRLFTAIEKAGFDRESLGNASTFASIIQNNRLGAKYGFEIHVHTYFINKILPEMLRFDFGDGIKKAKEYQNTIKDVEGHLNRAKTAATDTQGTQIGKSYASDYEEARKDYESLTKEWQDIVQKYQKELQELNRLATHANAVIFTISLSSDVRIVPDGSAVALALSECLSELNIRCETILKDAYLQHFSFREVRQPYFFFLSEIGGMFNPSMLALKASDPYFLELFKGMFPTLNAASVLQSSLENMRHLSSNAPAEILRKMLLQMEIGTPTTPPPMYPQAQGTAQAANEPPPRLDYLTEGELIGKDTYDRPVKINLRTLENHILIEGLTRKGKSTFAKLLASIAIEKYRMNVVVMDISYHWSSLLRRYGGVIFDRKLDVEEALSHPFTLCVGQKGNIEGIENNFLKPLYEHIKETRGHSARNDKDILLIVDEAHNFGKKLKRGVLVDIIAELGKYGIIVILISQRNEYVGIDARSQAGLRFNTQISADYVRAYADTYKKEVAEMMLHIKKHGLFVHGVDINRYFEMVPEYIGEPTELTLKECEQYIFKPPELEKQEPAPQVLTNTNERQISSSAPKPKEPEKPKDELSEDERKIVEFLKAYGKDCTSANKLFRIVLDKHSGDTSDKISKSLVAKGYITIEKPHEKKSIIRLTEKGKGQPK